MCCKSKPKKIQQKQNQPAKESLAGTQAVVGTSASVLAPVAPLNLSGNAPTASSLRSKLPIDKKLQKSTVKVQQVIDPRVTNFFKDCKTQRIELTKMTNQHNSYVRQYDYFDLSNNHQEELRKLNGLPDTRGAMYNVSESSTLSTPTVNRFCYDRNITDISYLPRTMEYRSVYPNEKHIVNVQHYSNATNQQGTMNYNPNPNVYNSSVQPVAYN